MATVPLLVVAGFLEGLTITIFNVNQISLRQAITPDQLQGRMNATMRFFAWGTIPIGSLLGGILGGIIGLRVTIFIAGIGMLLSFLWIFLSPLRVFR